jgi:serine protease Do
MEGQLNGRVLEPSFSFAQEIDQPESDPVSGDTGTYGEYVAIYDDAQSVTMEVPVEWSDVDGSAWESEGEVLGANLAAAPSLQGYYETWTTPGAQMLASAGLGGSDMGELVDNFDFSADCVYDGRFDYEDPVFTGLYDSYRDCAGTGNVLIVLAVEPEDASYSVVLIGQAVTSADLDALDRILDTFNVVGTLPGS